MSALMLRIIACVAMVLDHVGSEYNIVAFRLIGRIAFPLFVYLLCNGYRHTANRRNYALRLGIFAFLSQVPYSLFRYGEFWNGTGNVFFTLLLALFSIWSAEELRKRSDTRLIAFLPALVICLAYHFKLMASDYGARGIVLAMVFYYLDGRDFRHRILTAVATVAALLLEVLLSLGRSLLLALLGQGLFIPQFDSWDLFQIYGVLALLFIFLYNGKKGAYPPKALPAKLVQYGFYMFYPLHQLVLWLIRVLQ